MGCDIHLYFEKKNKEGKWQQIEIDERILPNERSYPLFAQIAGVRNSYGDPVIPWFADRGIPDDTSIVGVRTNDCSPWMGEHSFTYATLFEILSAPWDKTESLEIEYFYIFCRYVLPRLISFTGRLSIREADNIRVIMGFDN